MVEKLIKKVSAAKEKGNFRSLNYYEKKEGKFLFSDGRKYLNLSTNDYLGLSTDQNLLDEFYNNEKLDINRYGFSTVSSRLISGNSNLYRELENNLSRFYSKEKAIVFNSGYHLNTGVLPAITDKKDLILSDKLNHASIVDALHMSPAEHVRYRHLDYGGLEKFLSENREKYENVFIVTESVFSMDGDIADLKRLVGIKNKYGCFLYVDEAHAVGVYGKGRGVAYESGVIEDVDLFVGTFGKAFSSIGGFIATNEVFYELIVNYTRPFIFTTALPPVVISWNNFILNKMDTFEDKRSRLFLLTHTFREALTLIHMGSAGSSYIIPVIVKSSFNAQHLASYLKDNGILAPAIRPPTVPEGSSRIRLSLNPLISEDDMTNLLDVLSRWRCENENHSSGNLQR